MKSLLWIASSLDDLRAFQKKAKRGIATPKRDVEIVRTRLRRAEQHAASQKGPKG